MELFLKRRKISVSAVRNIVLPNWLVDPFITNLLYITWNCQKPFRRRPHAAGASSMNLHVEALKDGIRTARNNLPLDWLNLSYCGDQTLHPT
jgi:hypothetical protein